MTIPAFVITGFLGSGKTTLLLNSARKHFKDKKVAVIVNEFGEVGVDGKVLENVYSSVVELPEGCICCTLHAEFEKALSEIREKYSPGVILVETSGSAEPFPVAFSLKSLGCSLEAIICVIDAKNFHKYKQDHTALYQIGGSNVVVINKVDLVSQEELQNLEEEVRSIWETYALRNTFTGEKVYSRLSIYKTAYGILPEEFFAGSYSLNDLLEISQSDHHHHHSYYQSVQYYEEPIEYEELQRMFKELPEEVVRAKGIIRIKHAPYPVLVNYSFGYFDFGNELPNYKGKSFLVFISKTPAPIHMKL